MAKGEDIDYGGSGSALVDLNISGSTNAVNLWATRVTSADNQEYGIRTRGDFEIKHITSSGNISSSGKFIGSELSSLSDLTLDADGADILLKDGGTEFGRFKRTITS